MANTKVTVWATTTTVINLSVSPMMVALTNDSDEIMYISIGSLTAVMNEGIRLNANGGAIVIDTAHVLANKISAICASWGKNLCVSYL